LSGAVENLKNAILGRYPLIYLLTWEENRAMQLLEGFSSKLFGADHPLYTWTCLSGFTPNGSFPDSREPLKALQAIQSSTEKGFYVLKDFPVFFSDPFVLRALRDVYQALQNKDKYVFLVSSQLEIPESLRKEVLLVDLGLPDEEEVLLQLKRIQQQFPQLSLPPEIQGQISFALKGFTLNEINHTLNRIFRSKKQDPSAVLQEIFVEKEMMIKKSGFLEFVPPVTDLSQIGGLDNLKEWVVRREKLFSKQALDDGMPVPKGLLLMGMSGCGKSLSAKTISTLWKVPLFRLDMNLVFSGMYGNAEHAFHKALGAIEAMAPAVLWIDEIENSLGMDEGHSGSSNTHIFSTFLTWLQEKPPMVFVAATANRIHALPAEVIRKGRFDQVFFIDLPNDEERKQIFDIHLRKNGADISKFDLVFLAAATKGWSGAEIEQAVAGARVDAYHAGKEFEIGDITRNTSRTVPLSKTMEEQMKKIRSWAFGRATPASKYASVPRV
jgi:SpoVK/Ycf46/Vps4 family AAA+-type ATPase